MTPTDGRGWHAQIDAAGRAELHETASERLLEELHPFGGCVSSTTAGDRYGATFTVTYESVDALTATSLAESIFAGAVARAGLPAWPIVRLEVLTFDEMDGEFGA
jgi:hypothetical protein